MTASPSTRQSARIALCVRMAPCAVLLRCRSRKRPSDASCAASHAPSSAARPPPLAPAWRAPSGRRTRRAPASAAHAARARDECSRAAFQLSASVKGWQDTWRRERRGGRARTGKKCCGLTRRITSLSSSWYAWPAQATRQRQAHAASVRPRDCSAGRGHGEFRFAAKQRSLCCNRSKEGTRQPQRTAGAGPRLHFSLTRGVQVVAAPLHHPSLPLSLSLSLSLSPSLSPSSPERALTRRVQVVAASLHHARAQQSQRVEHLGHLGLVARDHLGAARGANTRTGQSPRVTRSASLARRRTSHPGAPCDTSCVARSRQNAPPPFLWSSRSHSPVCGPCGAAGHTHLSVGPVEQQVTGDTCLWAKPRATQSPAAHL